MHKTISRALALGAAGMLLGAAAPAADIHVIATGALKGAFQRLQPEFEQTTGHRLLISWGPSFGSSPDAIPSRLRRHEPLDVLIMVGPALDAQIAAGGIDAASRTDLAQTGIGIGVRQGAARPDIGSVDALRHVLLAARSIGYSEGASGSYIAHTLWKKLGIEQQVVSKVRIVDGKELVGEVIARGEVDIGLQQISELRVVPGVEYVGPLPDEVQQINVISAALAEQPPQRAAAQQLLAFLVSPAAVELFERSGLDPLRPH